MMSAHIRDYSATGQVAEDYVRAHYAEHPAQAARMIAGRNVGKHRSGEPPRGWRLVELLGPNLGDLASLALGRREQLGGITG